MSGLGSLRFSFALLGLFSALLLLLEVLLLPHQLLILLLPARIHAHEHCDDAANRDGDEKTSKNQPNKDRNEASALQLVAIGSASVFQFFVPFLVAEVATSEFFG